ncbi:MAG: HepT-like ribonuclease domain-containing protein [Candidatus Binatia bacterium]
MNHDAFVRDDKTVDSVVRNLEIIGEAANRLPEDLRTEHSQKVSRPGSVT